MPSPVGTSATHAIRASSLLAATVAVAGCGSGSGASGDATARARAAAETAPQSPAACQGTVMHTLGQIAKHVYHQGISSERTRTAFKLVTRSVALREAVERGDPRGVQAAAQSLIATGRVTNLRVLRGASGAESAAEILADAGGPAVTPLRGTIAGASGAPIARFVTSVWADSGIVAETNGLAESSTVLRAGGRTIAGSFALPPGELPTKGTLRVGDVAYRYSSVAADRYPSGSLRIYVFRPARAVRALCGATPRDTLVNTLAGVARVIYAGEAGSRAQTQVRRVQRDPALLRAVAARDPEATRLAIGKLLTEHIVRLRVSVGGRLLRDVGGPDVLAPVSGVLRAGGRTIGTFVLSIQDDEGYLRLVRRLGGMRVLMYAGQKLVKNSLGPAPGAVAETGSYTYRGGLFRTFTLHASAFPSGPLLIRVLVPIPYT
jgi:hypothetical protein